MASAHPSNFHIAAVKQVIIVVAIPEQVSSLQLMHVGTNLCHPLEGNSPL